MSSSTAIAIEKRETAAVLRVRTLPAVLGGLLVCLTFCFCCLRFNDPDTWLHLKLGQEIWQSHAIPATDHWTFTVNGSTRVDHEWAAQVLLYAAYHTAGYQGVQLWLCLLAAAIVGIVYTLCYRYSGSAPAAMLGGFVAFFFGTIGYAARPNLIGYALLALQFLIMERAWSGRPRLLWWLPSIFALWVNCHGSWFYGIGVLGLAAVCSSVASRRKQVAAGGPALRQLWIVLLCCFAAININPIGVKLLLYPLNVFFKQPVSLSFLTEWLPLTTQDVRGIGLFAVLLTIGAAALTGKARATVFEMLVLAPATFLALQHMRMVFVFGLVAAPIFCRIVAGFGQHNETRRDHPLLNALILLLALAACCAAFPSEEKIQADIAATNPVRALRFMRQAGLKGNLLNDYMWGGYLAWTAPEYKIFIDGRGDIFDWSGLLAQYRDWALVEGDPEHLLDDYGIRLCLLPRDAPEAHVMPHLTGWTKLYSDETAVLFGRE